MPASISTRLDEQEFLELADSYYVTSRREVTDNPSRTGSTTTLSTNTHLRRRDTPRRRWRPSTLNECDDYDGAGGEVDAVDEYDIVERPTFSYIVIDPLKTPTSISLESYSDDTQNFRVAEGRNITVSSFNAPSSRIQNPQIDPVARSPSSIPTKISRPISTASLVSRSCFGIISFPKWIKGSGRPDIRPRNQKNLRATESINRGTGESSGRDHGFFTIPLDSPQSGEEYFVSLPSRGFASGSSSALVGLDYDYHLAVEVLINGFDVETKAMP